jgi:hypothetical protein
MLKAKQVELDHIIKPIDDEKLAQIIDKKAKLPDEWVLSNMKPDKYKELQSYLNKEETRLKSIRANMDPSRLSELEGINETLKLWYNRFPAVASVPEDSGGGEKILEQTKPGIKIYGFEDIEAIESITSITVKRQVLDRLRINLVVFDNRIEIGCQIPIETDKTIHAILNLRL